MCPPNTKFFKQGSAVSLQNPPGGQLPGPLRTPRSQSVLPTIQNWMTPMHKQRGRGCGVGAAAPPPIYDDSWGKWATRGNLQLVMVELHRIRAWNLWWKWYKLENSLQSYVNFTLGGNKFSWTFKVLKPTSFRGLCTLDPGGGHWPRKGVWGCAALKTPFSRLSCRSQGSHFKQKSQFARPPFEKIWKF